MTLTTRPLEAKDIMTICSLPQNQSELFFMFPKATYPLTEAQLADAIKNRANSTVIEYSQSLAGFANFYQWKRKGRCSVGNVIVSPHVRSKGVGKALVLTMIELARSEYDASEIVASCFNKNARALLLYSSLGFEPFSIDERRDYDGERIALIHMRKPV